jgi:hypothetical protein
MLKAEHFHFLKPYIPRPLKIIIRRELVRRNLSRFKDVWPIDKESAKPPEGWDGWPDGKKFALVLTHDVERLKDPKKCYQLADLEERLGFRSSFNFVAGDYHVPAALRQNLTDRGFEVGVHGLHHDKNPFRSKSVFQKQAVEINRYIKEWDSVGFRTPSMYHDLQLLHHLNIKYDASTFDTDPFEPQPDGVRTIFPFWVTGNSQRGGYVELPYTLPQDFLLYILMQEKSIDIWKRKLDWIVEHGGMALFITHPDYMSFVETLDYDEYPARYYEKFLEHIKSKYEGLYWNVLPRDLSDFWVSKSYGKNHKKGNDSCICKKKKIWIDLDNSPHVPFFKPIIDELSKSGFTTILTARDCFQVCGLADLAKLNYNRIGRHYGKNLILKGLGLLIRSFQLLPIALHEKPDIAISHGSRSQILISSMLNIPSVLIADYEHAQKVVKPTYIFAPEMIPDSAVKGFTKSFYKYPGIKEDVYVPDFTPDPSILDEFGINEEDLLITIRPPATEAHYHNPDSELLFEATVDFLGQQNNTRMVILPRNEIKQTAWVKHNWSGLYDTGKIIIPEHVIDGLNLIWHSDLVISGGGTMNREAAALGVPVYSIFRGKIGAVDRYLSENGRLVLLETVEDVRTKIVLTKRIRSDTHENTNRQALHTIIEHIKTVLMECK